MSELKMYRMSQKVELVLGKLNSLEIPIFSELKSCEKLNLLMKCQHATLNFGSFVYRKGEKISSLFYLIQGEIKILNKQNEKTVTLGTI